MRGFRGAVVGLLIVPWPTVSASDGFSIDIEPEDLFEKRPNSFVFQLREAEQGFVSNTPFCIEDGVLMVPKFERLKERDASRDQFLLTRLPNASFNVEFLPKTENFGGDLLEETPAVEDGLQQYFLRVNLWKCDLSRLLIYSYEEPFALTVREISGFSSFQELFGGE